MNHSKISMTMAPEYPGLLLWEARESTNAKQMSKLVVNCQIGP